jgi:hypothetical protein
MSVIYGGCDKQETKLHHSWNLAFRDKDAKRLKLVSMSARLLSLGPAVMSVYHDAVV